MGISKRLLTKWRKEALKAADRFDPAMYSEAKNLALSHVEYINHVLQMTQELLDQHLLKEGDK